MFKKGVTGLLSFAMLLTALMPVIAEPRTIDLSAMTPAELQEFKSEVEKEYKAATDFPSSTEKTLTENVKSLFEQQFSTGSDYSYPWLGFSTSRSRTMYSLSGNCTVRYADKSRNSYDVSAYYWYNESSQKFVLALYMLDKTITIKNDEAIANIEKYLDQATLNLLGSTSTASTGSNFTGSSEDTTIGMAFDTKNYPKLAYEKAYRKPDDYKGKRVSFSGKVLQVGDGWFGAKYYRIATSGSSKDVVYVTIDGKNLDVQLMEDDRVTVYGKYDGNTTYTTVLGSTVTIPSVEAEKIELNKKK